MKKLCCIIYAILFFSLYAGQPEYGYKKYIEYIPGDLPIIIAAPHGGRLKDKSIADRKGGVRTMDTNTDKLAREVWKAFKKTGKTPHLVINHLHRIKLDCNRSKEMAYEGDKQALKVWQDYHRFIEKARTNIRKKGQKVLYVDIHAHGHKIQRLELGYLVGTKDLFKVGDKFNSRESVSSLKGLVKKSDFEDLIRGKNSVGAMMAKEGFPSVPSPDMPDPGKGNLYFNGGFNTAEYGARKAKDSFSFQVESNWKGVRDSEANRKKFGGALQRSLTKFYQTFIK